jgi:hypothetical protein
VPLGSFNVLPPFEVTPAQAARMTDSAWPTVMLPFVSMTSALRPAAISVTASAAVHWHRWRRWRSPPQ